MANNPKCPAGHEKTWLKGKVPTRSGLKARYVCYTCGRSFYKGAASVVKPKTKSAAVKRVTRHSTPTSLGGMR